MDWTPAAPEELIESLRECVKTGLYFELCPENAEVLLTYIETILEAAAKVSLKDI